MYARVITAQFRPGKLEEGLRIILDSIVPAAKQRKGFQGTYHLVDRKTDKSVAISLWDTEADARGGEASGFVQEQAAKVAALRVGPPTVEYYEVVDEA